MNTKIGFIGTGLMGFPMAKNLLKKNFYLKVFNRTITKAEPLDKFGAKISKSLGEVAKNSDLIITMLTDDEAVGKVLSNEDFLTFKKDSGILVPALFTRISNLLNFEIKFLILEKLFTSQLNETYFTLDFLIILPKLSNSI